MNKQAPTDLLRVLGLGALITYGVGDILGAGIYALIGKIAGVAGAFTWLSFMIAMGIVSLTALTYSELGSRLPKSGGVSVYIEAAFNTPWCSLFAGLLLFCATLLSMSTLAHAFTGYLHSLGFNLPAWFVISGFLLLLLLINLRGIKESSMANIIGTTIELSGLLIVVGCGAWFLSKNAMPTHHLTETPPTLSQVLQGAALAFFAFTGFEDMANVAEEVKNPRRTIPRAILSSISIAGILYLSVSWTATTLIPSSELAHSSSPLLDVVQKSCPALPSYVFAIIALFAVSNSTLLNYITASRLLYGMAQERLLPRQLKKVHPSFHTPYIAIFAVFPIVVTLGLINSFATLASSTSAVVLLVFSLSNLALIKIKWDEGSQKNKNQLFNIPLFIPCLGIVLNLFLISFIPLANLIPAALMVIACLVLTTFIQLVQQYAKF